MIYKVIPSLPSIDALLPCEIKVGAACFQKGVPVSILQGAIDRLYEKHFEASRMASVYKDYFREPQNDEVKSAVKWANRFIKDIGTSGDTSCLQTLVRAVTNKETEK